MLGICLVWIFTPNYTFNTFAEVKDTAYSTIHLCLTDAFTVNRMTPSDTMYVLWNKVSMTKLWQIKISFELSLVSVPLSTEVWILYLHYLEVIRWTTQRMTAITLRVCRHLRQHACSFKEVWYFVTLGVHSDMQCWTSAQRQTKSSINKTNAIFLGGLCENW